MFDLIKITKREYAEKLLDGDLYMNPLSYFRKFESDGQHDYFEGYNGRLPKEQLKQCNVFYDLTPKIHGLEVSYNVFDYSLDTYNIYCMYSMYYNKEKKIYQSINETFSAESVFGDVAVYIFKTEEFIKRIQKAVEKYCIDDLLVLGAWGSVHYCDFSEYRDGMNVASIFSKSIDYENQNEWRLAIDNGYAINSARILQIGDIHDIAKIIPKSDLDKEIKKRYSGYTNISDINIFKKDQYGYSMFCNETIMNYSLSYANATNKLYKTDKMASVAYNVKSLLCIDEVGKAIGCLNRAFEENKDVGIFKLILGFCREQNNKEGTLISLFINHILDKEKDFFVTPTGSLCFIELCNYVPIPTETICSWYSNVINNDNLSDFERHEIEKFIMSYFCCYDQIINLIDYTSDNANDLECLIFSNIFTLNIEQAESLLKKYRSFPNSPVRVIRRHIMFMSILKGIEKPLINNTLDNNINKRCSEIKENTIIFKNNNNECMLGMQGFYAVAVRNQWKCLSKYNKIYVDTNVITEIIGLYCNSGNKVLHNILKWLFDNRRRVEIKSLNINKIVDIHSVYSEPQKVVSIELSLELGMESLELR